MSEKIPYEKVMRRMRMDIDYIADEAYQKGFEAGSHEATTIQYQKGFDDANKTRAEVCKLAYNAGLNDAWECAKKISLMSPDEIEKVFPGAAKNNRYNLGYSGTEAIEKLKAYEQQKADAEIKVGDEVKYRTDDCGVVTWIYGNDAYVLWQDGSTGNYAADELIKTGRHFNFLASLLEAMKEGVE